MRLGNMPPYSTTAKLDEPACVIAHMLAAPSYRNTPSPVLVAGRTSGGAAAIGAMVTVHAPSALSWRFTVSVNADSPKAVVPEYAPMTLTRSSPVDWLSASRPEMETVSYTHLRAHE